MSGAQFTGNSPPMSKADLREWDDLAEDARRSRWSGKGIPYLTPSKRGREAARRRADERRTEVRTLDF